MVHEDTKGDDCAAWVSWDYVGKIATVGLSVKKCDDDNIEDIKRHAFHEICEILLCPLERHAENRKWNESCYRSEAHNIIRILENTIFKKDRK